ncbi:unnamed protein product [Phytomonas sp. EM1]|nr:unnamed protein product [Phytomonas sp. EM1]|eukprot:CCW63696.1 unnamed protein product [Phytomonas sp. isolate EM1]
MALRQREGEGGDAASTPVISQDIPWVVDLPHRGSDSIGRTAEEAVDGFGHYGSIRWMAPVRREFPWASSPKLCVKRTRPTE